jgi:hypothetical protein
MEKAQKEDPQVDEVSEQNKSHTSLEKCPLN